MVQIAIRASIRQRQDIPEGIKDLLGGRGPEYSGLIFKMFQPIREVIGSLELAYRRGEAGEKEKQQTKLKKGTTP